MSLSFFKATALTVFDAGFALNSGYAALLHDRFETDFGVNARHETGIILGLEPGLRRRANILGFTKPNRSN